MAPGIDQNATRREVRGEALNNGSNQCAVFTGAEGAQVLFQPEINDRAGRNRDAQIGQRVADSRGEFNGAFGRGGHMDKPRRVLREDDLVE